MPYSPKNEIKVTLSRPKYELLKLEKKLDLGSVWRVSGGDYEYAEKKHYIIMERVDGIDHQLINPPIPTSE